MRIERKKYYPPERILEEVHQKIVQSQREERQIDYITFVSDGEPTLDQNIGKEIQLLKNLEIKIAVITNASLITQEDVQKDLMEADWVSVKIDTVTESIWRKMNRPHHSLQLDEILEGIRQFSGRYRGVLATETMLVKGINDHITELLKISDFLKLIKPTVSYLAIPTRPPAESYAVAPAERLVNHAFHVFNQKVDTVEFLIGYEGNEFAFTGNAEEDLLSITAVHPMRADAVDHFLRKSNHDWSIIHQLIEEEKLIETSFEGNNYYLRKLNRDKNRNDKFHHLNRK